jgi:hypothetical protein
MFSTLSWGLHPLSDYFIRASMSKHGALVFFIHIFVHIVDGFDVDKHLSTVGPVDLLI